ncbi:hypothetical protein HALO59_100188 [Halomonas sp. 59]|nr:hypothetical protein HALO59_100188 [Halomonas sp. 59]CAD5248010.1 hypothetical protein HALO113_100209 [Halomonas sp. 113]CAD5252172.1 hypothetical protein HALO156_110095 [Halomonas sp. 156]CAD5256581.1 hypothetical protein HALOI3_140051 [Halomonas sp. I3]VXB97952.1 hypothetical protein HALO153_230082 [Halomonas titanicae]
MGAGRSSKAAGAVSIVVECLLYPSHIVPLSIPYPKLMTSNLVLIKINFLLNFALIS